jgi:hypothetical protein
VRSGSLGRDLGRPEAPAWAPSPRAHRQGGPRFRGSKKPPLSFIKMRQHRRLALSEKIFIDRLQNYDVLRQWGIPIPAVKPDPIHLLSDGR